MRVGVVLPSGADAELSRAAEDLALFGVLAGDSDPVTSINAAIYAAVATSAVRVVIRVPLGAEHPVTIAEEVAVLDNVSEGRSIVLLDTDGLGADDACAEAGLVRDALAARPVRLEGPRFVASNEPSLAVMAVTPEPAQLEVPMWVTGAVAEAVRGRVGLALFSQDPAELDNARAVAPAVMTSTGDPERDRDMALRWADAGATHLFVRLCDGQDPYAQVVALARVVATEVSMPFYPRVMTEAPAPLPWPREEEMR